MVRCRKRRKSSRSPATKKRRCRLHGGASGSGGPPGECNSQYRHGERTKAAIADRRAPLGTERRAVRAFRKIDRPRSRVARPGPLHIPETVDVDLVADIHPAEAWHPPPAAGSDHHDAAEAAPPVAVAVAVVAATHPTTLAATAGGSFGRDE